jgi:hypothetical protein
MFLDAAGDDLTFARLAAAETLSAYRAETHAYLITIAKIIAFGLATLGSLSLSMADDLSLAKILRLRASANASDRAEHRNRLVLDRAHLGHPTPQPNANPGIEPPALTATVAETRQRTAENPAKITPSSPTPPAASVTEEQHYQASWAACAAAIAAETASSLPELSTRERQSAAVLIEVLNEAANSFLTDGIPHRLRPGDLAALMRGA